MKRLLLVVALGLGVTAGVAPQDLEPTFPASPLRWHAEVDKALNSGGGEGLLFGAQREVRFRIWLINPLGPQVFGIDALINGIDVTLELDDDVLPVEAEVVPAIAGSFGSLGPGESVQGIMSVRARDRLLLGPGRYRVKLDLTRFFRSVRTERGSLERVVAERDRVWVVRIRSRSTPSDWINFYDREGHSRLRDRRPTEAIPFFEQLVRLDPSPYQWFWLGRAYLRAKRFEEAITAFERVLPGW